MIRWIHYDLLVWGRWAASVEDRGRGYPRQASFVLRPGRGSGGSGWWDSSSCAPVMDWAIQSLENDRTRAVIVRLYKTGYNISRTARDFKVNRSTVEYHRDRGHVAIAGLLSRVGNTLDRTRLIP